MTGRKTLGYGVALGLGWLIGVPAAAAAPAGVPSLAALPIAEPVLLDGRLDEPQWARAEVGRGFTQREPEELAAATEPTEVRVVYTPETLYVGILALDSQPEEIVAREMGRDAPLFRDDGIVVLLDTFHDRRNAYFFETNPNASRTDALVTDEGRDVNFEWDGVWRVATARLERGWSVEMAIPFATLRFRPGLTTWGMNVRRIIRRKNEETFWSPIGLEADLFRLSRAGELTGLTGMSRGRALAVKPYVTAAAATAAAGVPRPEDGGDGGLDVKWGVARGMALDLTVNTDFAETEVDEQRVNLTRFSLFFPEKREFFLENAGIFEVGPDFGRGAPLVRPFFSRRIGISGDGRPVPIDAGARLTGRLGRFSVGALGVRTGGLGLATDGAVPETDWGVVRLKGNVGERSSVGMLYTHRRSAGGAASRLLGVDADLKWDRLGVWAFGLGSDGPGMTFRGGPVDRGGEEWAAGAGATWAGAIWEGEASVIEIREGFDPAAGFLLRSGVRRYRAQAEYEPRPERWPRIRHLSFKLEGTLFTTPGGVSESLDLEGRLFGLRLASDDFFTFFVNHRLERLFAPFEIFPGVVIAEGEHRWQTVGLFATTNEGRRMSAQATLTGGGFFDGDRFESELTVRLRASRYLSAELGWDHNAVELPAGSFTTNLVRQRLGLALSPEMSLAALVQWSETGELAAANLRFNWIYRPGADLFVVYNQTWETPGGGLRPRDRQLVVKLTYLFQR